MVMAGAESAFYSGFALGPTIGSFLYDVAAFHLPFVTLGSLNIAFSCIMSLGMPEVQEDFINTGTGSLIFHSQFFQVNKTVYTIPDDTEFRATSIAWKLPYFELKKYNTKLRLPSQNGIKIKV